MSRNLTKIAFMALALMMALHASAFSGFAISSPSPRGVTARWGASRTQILVHIPEAGTVRVRALLAGTHTIKVRRVGRTDASTKLSTVEMYNGSSKARRLHAHARLPLVYSTYTHRGHTRIFLPLLFETSKRFAARQTQFDLILEERGGSLVVVRARRRSTNQLEEVGRSCAASSPYTLSALDHVATAEEEEAQEPQIEVTRYLGLEVNVDSRFSSLYGADTEAIVLTVLQQVNQIYSSQLGVEVRLTAVNIYTNPQTDPYIHTIMHSETLLNLLQNVRSESTADLVHLFTSARGFLDAIGLSYIGVVCDLDHYKYGWSDYASGFYIFAQTVAHEIGHNFGAEHDSTDLRSIMAVSNRVDVTNPYFSAFSLAQMNGHLNVYSSCLSNSDDSAIGTPGAVSYPLRDESRSSIRLSIHASKLGRRGQVRGRVASKQNGKLAGRVIELRRYRDSRLLKTVISDSKGSYKFRVKPDGTFYTVDRLSLKTSNFAVEF